VSFRRPEEELFNKRRGEEKFLKTSSSLGDTKSNGDKRGLRRRGFWSAKGGPKRMVEGKANQLSKKPPPVK